MTHRFYLLLLILVVSLSGCEKAADISSPALYEKGGVRFSYPGNWDVPEDEEEDGRRYLFIESPGSAIVYVLTFPAEDAIELKAFADWFSETTKGEMPVGKIENCKMTAVDTPSIAGMRAEISELCDIQLLGLNVPHERSYFLLEGQDKSAYLITQTAVEDKKKVDAGFKQVLESFELK